MYCLQAELGSEGGQAGPQLGIEDAIHKNINVYCLQAELGPERGQTGRHARQRGR
jgi:hypothetical protein